MRIKIQSDFRDYYDHAFYKSHETQYVIFQREKSGGPSRSAMFTAFASVELMTPRYGLVRDLVPVLQAEYSHSPKALLDMMQIVVYLDEKAHVEESKQAMTWEEALLHYPNAFAVEFLPTIIGHDYYRSLQAEAKWVGSTSLRHLRIGRRMFWLRYTSQDDWRSHCGKSVQIDFLCDAGTIGGHGDTAGLSEQLFFDLSPMVAVDYLLVSKNMYAINLNVAPVLRDTGIERILQPYDVFHEVHDWFESKKERTAWKTV